MKKNLLFIFSALLMTFVVSCSKTDDFNSQGLGEEILIGISTSGIEYETLPNPTRSGDGENLLAVQVYEVENGVDTPYAKGLFSSWSALNFKGYSGATYKVEATMVVDATTKLQKTGEVYGKPFDLAVSDSFVYDSEPIIGIANSVATLVDGTEYTVPNIDRYYGYSQKQVTLSDASITTSMKRMSFGVMVKDINIDNKEYPTVIFQLKGEGTNYSPVVREVSNNTMVIYSFENIIEAYNADESSARYAKNIEYVIVCPDELRPIHEGSAEFQRNMLATITVTADGRSDVSIGFDFETPFEDGETTAPQGSVVLSDNLHYGEIQKGVSPTFWVKLKEGVDPSSVKWSFNGFSQGSGETFTLNSPSQGTYNITYTIGEETKSATLKVYTSQGVYILNEPNMTGGETIRGINKHIWGEETVTRFVEGDYSQFGTTNQYIQNWDGKLYVVAAYPQTGVAFSRFDATTGAFLSAHKSVNGAGMAEYRAFAGISPSLGVITIKSGAYLVNLNDFSIESTALKGSNDAKNVLVSDGYLFVVTAQGAVAYLLDNLSTETEPVVLGSATTGFVKTKDGDIWAANGGTLLRINPKTLASSTTTIPDGAQIKFSTSPWKPVSWVASQSENTFYFNKDSWGTAKEVYKYDVDTQSLTSQFITSAASMGNYMLYANSLYYDAERNEVICQGIKGYGDNSDYNGIWGFNADSGVKSFGVLYDTSDREIYPYKDMFFPAMMAPIKSY